MDPILLEIHKIKGSQRKPIRHDGFFGAGLGRAGARDLGPGQSRDFQPPAPKR